MKILSKKELKARIVAAKSIIENYQSTGDLGFSKKVISSILFRDHGLENYQPLFVSDMTHEIFRENKSNFIIDHFRKPRSRIFPSFSRQIKKAGLNRSDFTLEHVVDVSSMIDFLLESNVKNLYENVLNLGRTCPLCIVTAKEDAQLKPYGRKNIQNPWLEYDNRKIERVSVRGYCGPLI